MHELIQELKFFDKQELKYLNDKIDLKEFSDSQVGFLENPRVDKSVRSNTGLFLDDNDEVASFIHERMNDVLLQYRDNLLMIHDIYDCLLYTSDAADED